MDLSGKAIVLMPVFNAEKHLKTSVDSILNQTYEDFKLLIINDGSTDSSAEIVKEIKDDRVVFIENEVNMGIVKTLNRGIKMIDSEYIIRMDSDDVARPERIEKQIKYMDDNPNIAVSGTGTTLFREESKKKKRRVIPTTPQEVRSELFFNTPLQHPTVILRNNVLKEEKYFYMNKYNHSEDFGLWQEIATKYDIANINEVLLEYRVHESSLTQQADKKIAERDAVHQEIHKDYFSAWGINTNEADLVMWRKFNSGRINMKNLEEVKLLNDFIKKIKNKLNWTNFDEAHFDRRASFRFRTSASNSGLSIKEVNTLYKNEIDSFEFDRIEKLKMIVKGYLNK